MTALVTSSPAGRAAPAAVPRGDRDPFLDALRSGSLAVVVLWHWFGTVLTWNVDGPHATNVLSSVPGLWLATWVLQVVPMFFYVGGHLHRRAYRPGFVARRVGALLRAALPLLAGWAVAGAVLAATGGTRWAAGVALFALSPLWFLGVYLGLVLLLPVAVRLDARCGRLALPALVVAVIAVDAARFGLGVPWIGWLNLPLVWGLVHQAGFRHHDLLRAPRWSGWLLVTAGLLALAALLALGYPGSMVGVPGQRWSNMSPPTCAIAALAAVQIGLIRLAYPSVSRLLARPAARRVLAGVNGLAMPVFLFHESAFLLVQAVGWPVFATALGVTAAAWWVRRTRAR